jgi:hypothetical protein
MLERDALVSDLHGARWPLGEKEILHRHLRREPEKIQGLRAGNKDVTVRSCRNGLGDGFRRGRKGANARMNSWEFVDALSQTANSPRRCSRERAWSMAARVPRPTNSLGVKTQPGFLACIFFFTALVIFVVIKPLLSVRNKTTDT